MLYDFLAVICFVIALVLFGLELYANQKRKKIKTIKQQIHMPFENGPIKNAAKMSAVYTGISFFDVYATLTRHLDVFEVLEQRYPTAHGAKDMWDWFEHISHVAAKNADSLGGYVTGFKGQAAENIALEMLRDRGLDASLFDSLTNKTNDIFVKMGNGRITNYSVKCGSTDYVKQCIENSDATNFIINSESYAELDSKGLIDFYESQGIDIIDGNYSDVQLTSMAEKAFDELADAGDVSDSIPYLALACLGFKTYKNIKSAIEGNQSSQELAVNFGLDVAKFGTTTVLAGAGAELGAYIGTLICPGVGTLIGAGIGVFGGASIINSVFEYGKERFKWGKIVDAQDYFGEKFLETGYAEFREKATKKYLQTDDFEKIIEEERKLYNKYQDELNPYKIKKVSVPAVLTSEYYTSLEIIERKISYTKSALKDSIVQVCETSVKELKGNKKEKFKRRLIGELVIGNSDCLPGINERETAFINDYRIQKQTAPNYPCRFTQDPIVVLETLVKQTFNSYNPYIKAEKTGLLNRVFIFVFAALGILFNVLS